MSKAQWWNPPANAGDAGSIPGLGRPPAEENGNPLKYLAWEILWKEEPGELQSMGSQRVGYDLAIEQERDGLCRGSPSIFDSFYFGCQDMSCTGYYNATTFSSFRLYFRKSVQVGEEFRIIANFLILTSKPKIWKSVFVIDLTF